MRSRPRIKLLLGAALVLLVRPTPPVSAADPPPAPPSPLVLVVAASSPLTNISMATVRALFSGDVVTEPSVGKLTPLNQPIRTPDRMTFDRIVLRMNAEQVGNFWIDRRIRGLGHPPRVADSARVALLFAARFPGAITYVRASQLTPGVRALRIDGKAHTDPDYALAASEPGRG